MVVNVILEQDDVKSFKGRTGAVVPQSGDYTPVMVGVTAGTTDLTAGSSKGTPGTFYFVYKT